MIEIEKPQIECIETPGDDSYGKYVVEPLERGYGTTLGNALRRIMLSSLPGTAATSIKITGVQHEFTTIPGVKEDVTEIVLNVKQLITKLHSEGVKTVFIEAVGPCEVTAGDIKSDGEVEVLNPELHIATLGSGATLNMEITLSHGRGYVPADRNKSQQQNIIGVIPVDSIYTPVYKVNYTVENTRVGNMTDFDKLTIESRFQALSPGGAISYVEVPDMQNNIPAVMAVLNHIYDNIMYAELNTKSDYCQCCGFDGEIQIVEDRHGKLVWECPSCGNRDQDKMNVARRTCGYIGTQFWNQGRTQEIKDRVLHL